MTPIPSPTPSCRNQPEGCGRDRSREAPEPAQTNQGCSMRVSSHMGWHVTVITCLSPGLWAPMTIHVPGDVWPSPASPLILCKSWGEFSELYMEATGNSPVSTLHSPNQPLDACRKLPQFHRADPKKVQVGQGSSPALLGPKSTLYPTCRVGYPPSAGDPEVMRIRGSGGHPYTLCTQRASQRIPGCPLALCGLGTLES